MYKLCNSAKELNNFIVSYLYQTMVLCEIKSSDTFIVLSTLKGIDSASVHQRKIKCTLGRTLCGLYL